jgi:hypothetical protein
MMRSAVNQIVQGDECYKFVTEKEKELGIDIDFIIKARPDIAYLKPMLPYCEHPFTVGTKWKRGDGPWSFESAREAAGKGMPPGYSAEYDWVHYVTRRELKRLRAPFEWLLTCARGDFEPNTRAEQWTLKGVEHQHVGKQLGYGRPSVLRPAPKTSNIEGVHFPRYKWCYALAGACTFPPATNFNCPLVYRPRNMGQWAVVSEMKLNRPTQANGETMEEVGNMATGRR